MKNPVLTALLTAATIAAITTAPTPGRALAAPNSRSTTTTQDPATTPGMSVKVSAETISKLLHTSIQDSRTIADWVSGTFIQGTTLTNATATLRVRPDAERAAIDIVIDSETTADTVGYNQPIPSIGIDVSFSSFTQSQTIKTIYVDPNLGILVTPAQSSSATSMTIHNVNAWAGGLFRNLKRKMAIKAAWRKLMQEKANQEYQISMRVNSELNGMADTKTKEILHPVNNAFKKYFVRGFLGKNRMPGPFLAKTTEAGTWLTAWAPQASIGTPDQRLNDPSRGGLSVHLNGAVINHTFETLLGGVEFTSGEMAEIVAFANGFADPVPRNKYFKIHLRENNPIEISFNEGVMTLRIVTTKVMIQNGNEEPGAIAEARFSITREADQTIHIKREGQIEVLPLPPATQPSPTVARAINYYFNGDNQGLDKRIKLGQLPGNLAKLGSLELLGLNLQDGWLMLESKLNPPPATIAAKSERGQK